MAGSFRFGGFDVDAALERIAHRGPDGQGSVAHGEAVHGHVRLALVDLTDASAQPFKTPAGVLTFVGEIWNYKALRSELRLAGEKFKTTGDTEVLAKALAHWGVEDALPRLEGMFTFCWTTNRRAVLVRDRFGKVPLYVHRTGRSFAWASERKGLRGLACLPLPPGAILDLEAGDVTTWYDVASRACWRRDGEILPLLREGVAARLEADAPVCALVSGGLDSSLILALAAERTKKLTAYTAVHAEASVDLKAARAVCRAFGVDLIEVKVPTMRVVDLEQAARAIEVPLKTQVEIAALCLPLAEAISKDGFKACLSGEGADEIFGGYGSMCIKGSSADDEGWRQIRLAQIRKMSRGNFVRCNKAFMAYGVECRLPFLERRLVERAIGMTKAECPPGKKALKAAARGLVPDAVISRPKDTFQGASGLTRTAEGLIAQPVRYWRATIQAAYGRSAVTP